MTPPKAGPAMEMVVKIMQILIVGVLVWIGSSVKTMEQNIALLNYKVDQILELDLQTRIIKIEGEIKNLKENK